MSKPKRPKRELVIELCPRCGAEFPKTKPNRRFCSERCKLQDWNIRHPRIGFDSPRP